ncbi:Copine protein 2 [Bulinus truncatus]|nr:Copine protein 2 [Bulinus truncatus]
MDSFMAAVIFAAVFAILLLLFCKKKNVQRSADKYPATEERRFISNVTEAAIKPKRQPHMLANTERTESLYELFKSKSVSEVASQVSSLDEVSAVIAKAGLETCNLIFGIDYTGSNYMQGKKTFGGKCLHEISDKIQNPYQSVIATLGETLEPFDSDGAIPAFGFGDAYTKDHSVFPLKPDGIPSGFKEVLQIYNQLTPKVRLGGPTNFAPLIRQAIEIVKATNSYHILVIVADGQVTNEKATTQAIVEASNYPLSIVTVGVGDGPWDTMQEFDDKLPIRNFDNFHFVDYAKVTKGPNPNESFAIHALKEIPDQFKAIKKLQLLHI